MNELCFFCGTNHELTPVLIKDPDEMSIATFICQICSEKITIRESEYVCARCERPITECCCD